MNKPLQGNEEGLLAYYTFEEDTGTETHDISPNGNDGTLINMDTAWATAAWQTFTTKMGIPIKDTLLGYDADGDSLIFQIATNGNKGIATIKNSSTGEFTYIPNADQSGTDTFTYFISDGISSSTKPGTVAIEISVAINQRPSFTTNGHPPAITEDAGQQSVLVWVATFNQGVGDVGQTVADYIITNISNPALFEIEPDIDNAGNLIYTPATNVSGTATFDVAVQDNGGIDGGGIDTSDFQTFTITVNPVADTPSVTNAYTEPAVQSTSGLVISRHSADGIEVTHFKITNIQNGILYKNDGTTTINHGDFITFAEGNAGLKFTPDSSTNNGSFEVQASLMGNKPKTFT